MMHYVLGAHNHHGNACNSPESFKHTHTILVRFHTLIKYKYMTTAKYYCALRKYIFYYIHVLLIFKNSAVSKSSDIQYKRWA